MPILPRLIDILLKLYNDIPDDVYDEEQVRKNVFSSLRSIFTLFKKIASDKKQKHNFIFRSNAEIFTRPKDSLKEEALLLMFQSLLNLTKKLSFEDELDNDIAQNVCDYLLKYLKTEDPCFVEKNRIDPFAQKADELIWRIDCPAIVCCLFCQILFAHSYRKMYSENLSVKYPDRLLFNSELDKYQFSLPYEDQVTCSYFVYRYIYLPEERDRQYSDTRNKYDCGYKSSKPMKYKFTEVNKIIAAMNNSDTPGDNTTSYSNFVGKIAKLNLIKSKKGKSKNYSLLKLYLLVRKIKHRRDVVRSAISNDTYGFDIFKMLNTLDIENFIFDGLPYQTVNGFHSTLLLSEIKKDVDFKNLVLLTKNYIMAMDHLFESIDLIYDKVRNVKRNQLETLSNELHKVFANMDVTHMVQCQMSDNATTEDVMQQALALVYLQANESCMLSMRAAFQYIFENMDIIASDKFVGIFENKGKSSVLFNNIKKNYPFIIVVIENHWSDLLPPKKELTPQIKAYHKIIINFINESKTPSYNEGRCSFRFLLSMVLVCLLAEKNSFKSIPRQSYYHSGQIANSTNLYDLLKTRRHSPFKHILVSNLFETFNDSISGRIVSKKMYIKLIIQYYNEFLEKTIPQLKNDPVEGLKLLNDISYTDLLEFRKSISALDVS